MQDRHEYTSIEEQIGKLREEGLKINDYGFAYRMLTLNGYSSVIKNYKYLFLELDSNKYRKNSSFHELFALYDFNRRISALFLEYMIIIEHNLKTIIADCFSKQHTPTAYRDSAAFSLKSREAAIDKTQSEWALLQDEIEKTINKVYQRSSEKTAFEEYEPLDRRKEIPLWLLFSKCTFGVMRRFFSCLNDKDKAIICKKLGIKLTKVNMSLRILNIFRNACAHDECVVMYRFNTPICFEETKNLKKQYNGVYGVIHVMKKLLDSSQFLEFYSRFNEYQDELFSVLQSLSSETIKQQLGFHDNSDVVSAQFGSFTKGNPLSDNEFELIVKRYIMPLIPQSEIVKSPTINKSGYRFAEKQNKHIYISQSEVAEHSICLRLQDSESIDEELMDTIEEHIKKIISYIRIVWNTYNARVLQKRETGMLFMANAEIAYQLALCDLLCCKETFQLLKEESYQHLSHRELKSKYREAANERNTANEDLSKKNYIKFLTQSEKETLNDSSTSLSKLRVKLNSISQLERQQRETVYSILSHFDQWSSKTYEGQQMPFGIIVHRKTNRTDSFSYIDFLGKNYCATISDGSYSAVEVYADGMYYKHTTNVTPSRKLTAIPYPHQGFAASCNNGKIGVLLTKERDIIIISEGEVVCSKHNGNWTYSLHKRALSILEKQLSDTYTQVDRERKANSILQTLVDVAYSHGGACIALADSDTPPTEMLRMAYPSLLNKDDQTIVEQQFTIEDYERNIDNERITALRQFITRERSFFKLNPFLRRELIEMDGALLLGSTGIVYAVAAIVKLQGSGTASGARSTAAMQLSKYGLAIKVSQDGFMVFYKHGKEILNM